MHQNRLLGIENITKMYNENTGIKDISFTINKSEIHGLIGVNGAGKTSIIKLILKLLKEDSGEITWKNENIKNIMQYRRSIGYVPDDEVLLDNLTPMEIMEFVGFSYGLNRAMIMEKSCRIFEVLDLVKLNTNVNSFSRGMRKKVQLASAILSNPELLILDEPIAGFDPNMIFLLKQLFLELKRKGSSLLISTHDLNFASEICDKVTFIQDGQVLLTGNIKELLRKEQCNSLEELFISKSSSKTSRERLKNVVENL